MSPRLLLQLATGPVFALLSASTYRAALWVLDGTVTDTHVWWGVVASVVAMLLAWSNVMVVSRPSDLELERDGLRAAAEEALAALEDSDTAWTPAGTDTRQALRHALGHGHAPGAAPRPGAATPPHLPRVSGGYGWARPRVHPVARVHPHRRLDGRCGMRRDTYPEWQDWQKTCRVCERVKCPKPEAVGEWLEKLVSRLHEMMLPDLQGHSGWRRQAAFYESMLQCYTVTWSWALRGVCPDCIKREDPKAAAYLDQPELVDFDAAVRWSCLAPSFKAVSLVRAHTPNGLVRVPAVWRHGGLSVHPSVDFWPPNTGWCITHDRTGFRVTMHPEQDEATALAELLSEVADWEALDLAAIEADKELQERVRHVVSVLSAGGAE